MAELMNYSIQNTSFSQLMMIFAVSLGCGLLIGLERERSKSKHKTKTFAGFRTFAITSLLGTLCFLFNLEIGITGAILVGAISIASLRNQQDDPGVTTELAFIMTYFIGAVCIWNINLAAGLAVTLTILLFAKETLHGLANQWISETELRDGVLLLALILIGLPLAPDKAYWGPVLNPYTILKLLSLILLVQALAHFAKRLLSSRNAIVFSSLASGFVFRIKLFTLFTYSCFSSMSFFNSALSSLIWKEKKQKENQVNKIKNVTDTVTVILITDIIT